MTNICIYCNILPTVLCLILCPPNTEARAANLRVWLLNSTFLLARCHIQQNNRPEARASLIEGAALARSYRLGNVAEFFDTVSNKKIVYYKYLNLL